MKLATVLILLVLELVPFLAVPLLAGSVDSGPGVPLEELMELSGINRMLDQIPGHFDMQIEQRKAGLSPEQLRSFRAAVGRAYSPDRLKSAAVARLSRSVDRENVAATIDFLRSPLALKMTRLEIAASTAEAAQRMQEYGIEMEQAPPPPERLALIDRLEQAARSTETGLRLFSTIVMTLERGMAVALPEGSRLSPAQLQSQVHALAAQMRPVIHQSVMVNLLFAYREASDVELDEYVRFHEGRTGQRLVEVMNESMLEAITSGAQSLADEMARGLSEAETEPGSSQ